MMQQLTETVATDALTVTEKERLKVLEAQIQENLFGYRQVGAALAEIHDKRLYRETRPSFSDYLKFKWTAIHSEISRSYAWRVMDAERTTQAIEAESVANWQQNGVDVPMPTKPGQVRPLSQLPMHDRPAAWALAAEVNGGEVPTGAQVSQVVAAIQPTRLDFLDTDPHPQPAPDPDKWIDARPGKFEGIPGVGNDKAKPVEPRHTEEVSCDGHRLRFQLIVPTRQGSPHKWWGAMSRKQWERAGLVFKGPLQETIEDEDDLRPEPAHNGTSGPSPGVAELVNKELARVAGITGEPPKFIGQATEEADFTDDAHSPGSFIADADLSYADVPAENIAIDAMNKMFGDEYPQ